MSLSYTELKPIKVIDPRVNVSEAKNYLFKQGANVVTHRTFTANSASNSSVTFKCNPPNPDIVVSRLVYVTMQFTITIRARRRNAADNAWIPLDLSNYFSGTPSKSGICLRQFPLASVMRSLKVNINSDTLTVQPYQYIHALGRYNLEDVIRATAMSSSPAQPDAYQKYNDRSDQALYTQNPGGVNPAVAGSIGRSLGEVRSPFSNYGDTGYEIPRGSYIPDSVSYDPDTDDPTIGLTTATYTITEPLFISPLSSGDYGLMGFSQVSTMDIEIQLDSAKLNRLLSIDYAYIQSVPKLNNNNINENSGEIVDGKNGVIVSTGENSNQRVSFIYLTPQINVPKPESLIYDYHNLYIYSRNLSGSYSGTKPVGYQPAAEAGDGPNVNTNVISNNMSLSSIPSRAYIFAIRTDKDMTPFTTDCFARIQRIDINFNGVSGILSSANEWELWRMSCDNGLKLSYPEWQEYTGSVLCIDFGKNMGLGPQQCVGLLGTFDFSYKITIQNINTEKVTFDLITLVDSAGTFTISNGQVIKQLGVVSSSDVLQSEEMKEMDQNYLEKLYGGNFMSGLKNVYSKAQKLKPMARKGSKIAKELADPVGSFLPRVGKGMRTGADVVDMLIGEGYSRKDIQKMKRLGYTNKDLEQIAGNLVGGGNSLAGGRGMSKSKLMRRMESIR